MRKAEPSLLPLVAVGYSRQSRTRQADMEAGRIVSPEMQLDQARHYALARGWQWDEELTRAAIEINTSGGQSKADKKRGESSWKKRRGLSLLLEAAQAGCFAHLIVFKLSRLARSAREGLEICDAFERAGVSIHSASEGIDYSTASGRMIRTMMLAVAEMELESIREFAIESMYARAKSGKHHGPWPSWIERNSEGEFVLSEPQASAHRRLIELRMSGASHISIARQLNAEGYEAARGGKWTTALVSHALESAWRHRYLGHSTYQSGDLREPIFLPCVFPPLITQAEADELESVMKALSIGSPQYFAQYRNANRRTVESTYFLVELAYCPVCGGKLVGVTGSRSSSSATASRSYACKRAAEIPDAHPDRERRLFLAAEMLEGAVLWGLATLWQKWGEQLIRPAPKIKPAVPVKYSRGLTELDAAEKRLWEAYEAGGVTVGALRSRLAVIEEERATVLAIELAHAKAADAVAGWQALAREDLTQTEIRLVVRRLVSRIEAPLSFKEVVIDRHNRSPARWARVQLVTALPDGAESFLVALHRETWTGPVHVHIGEGIPSPPAYYPPAQSKEKKSASARKRRSRAEENIESEYPI